MGRLLAALAAVIAAVALPPSAAAAKGGPVLPAGSKAWGASLATWQERYMGWSLGSADKPVLTDICGEKIGGVFYLNTTPSVGATKHVTCHLRRGTRLLGTVGAAVALPSPGESGEELLAELRTGPDPAAGDPRAVLDGRSLRRSVARSFRYSEVYTIDLEPGNIAELLEPSLLGQSSTRVASYGWWLRIRPLSRGHHELRFSLNPPVSGFQEIRFHITVAGKRRPAREPRHHWGRPRAAP